MGTSGVEFGRAEWRREQQVRKSQEAMECTTKALGRFLLCVTLHIITSAFRTELHAFITHIRTHAPEESLCASFQTYKQPL